jgi:hypothetical protein
LAFDQGTAKPQIPFAIALESQIIKIIETGKAGCLGKFGRTGGKILPLAGNFIIL